MKNFIAMIYALMISSFFASNAVAYELSMKEVKLEQKMVSSKLSRAQKLRLLKKHTEQLKREEFIKPHTFEQIMTLKYIASNQERKDFFRMIELDDKIPTMYDVNRKCAVYGEESEECDDIFTRSSYDIPYGFEYIAVEQ